uniref:Uncharacterized protein n=1 Tax=Arundo donax TaxID=35708 RepID=A0A0A9BL48_ARUDO
MNRPYKRKPITVNSLPDRPILSLRWPLSKAIES